MPERSLFDLGEYAINVSIPVVIGTAIAIFLGFRTNSAYERWWEARKLWGRIINDSRSLVRLCNDYFGTANQTSRDDHLAYIKASGDKIAMAGPMLNDMGGMIGSLIILDVEDMDAARAWADGDPYAKAGLFQSVELIPWKKVVG